TLESTTGNPVIVSDPNAPPPVKLNPNVKVPPSPPAPTPPPDRVNPFEGVPGYSSPQGANTPEAKPLREALPGRDYKYVRAQVVDPQPKADKKPIVIRVEGNKLVFESEDTAALDAISSYLQATFGSGAKPAETLFKVIKLKN